MKRLFVLSVLLAASFAAATDKPSVRLCVLPLENHSGYQLPADKLQEDLASQLSHKEVKAFSISTQDIPGEMAKNSCDYLVRGEFADAASLKGKVAVDPSGHRIVIDERKHFALQFTVELKKTVNDQPLYSRVITVVDKNPKTCADDQLYEAVGSIRDYLKGHS